MEVTKSNFDDLFPEIVNTIHNSTFISIDLELTGLSDGFNKIQAFDTPAQYYSKLKNGSMDFLCIQVGVVGFSLNHDLNEYTYKAYNFYTFPRSVANFAPDCRFLCQSSSINFLQSFDFDFNKLFKEGITFMNLEHWKELDEKMRERRAQRDLMRSSATDTPPVPVPPQHKKTVHDAFLKLTSVISPECEEEEVTVEGCNGFVRKFIYQAIREKYTPEKLFVETRDGVMVSRKGKTAEELEDDKRKKEELDQELIESAIGFSKVVQEISKSGKLVVGHNCILDLCHLCQHFLCDLPESYEEFKNAIHSLFPWIIDTKFIASSDLILDHLKVTHLENVYTRTKDDPFSHPKISYSEGYGYEDSFKKMHEAAYDAFITGMSFISLYNYICNPDNPSSCAPVWKSEKTLSDKLLKYVNRLYLMWTSDTHLRLDGSDPKLLRNHIFFLTFPKSWTQNNIYKLFSPYGAVYIWWVNDTTAWVALSKKDESSNVIKGLCRTKSILREVTVTPYARAISFNGKSSSPRPNNAKRSNTSPNGGPSKKRKSSSDFTQRNIDTIPEENDDCDDDSSHFSAESFKDDCIKDLEGSNVKKTGLVDSFSLDNADSWS